VTRLLEPSPEDRYQSAEAALLVLTGPAKVVDTNTVVDTDFTQGLAVPVDALTSSLGDFNVKPRRPATRARKPVGTRVVVERFGSTKLLLVIPPADITTSSAATGGFAVAWNAFVAFWTVSALSGGGGLLMVRISHLPHSAG